ncbi:MAG: DegT/DnrJ/EryC1/StrS family aminotransferase [bacterium]
MEVSVDAAEACKMKQPLIDLKAQYNSINNDINKAIEAVINRSDFILGKDVREIENDVAEYLGVSYCAGVASGTDALIIALESCGIREGDEVVTTPFTFIATAEAIQRIGGKTVFVDIKVEDALLDWKKIKGAVTEKTKAILPVHLFGQPADMDEIAEIANENKLFIVEDCAQSFGAVYKNKKVGSFGKASCFSFFPGKNLGAFGDGGMIATNDSSVNERVRMLRNHGSKDQYNHIMNGYNSRLDTLQAAVLKVKLKYIDEWNARRRDIAKIYNFELQKLGFTTFKGNTDSQSSMNYYSFLAGSKRDALSRFLTAEGIANKIYYPIPLHMQKALSHLGYKRGDFPVSEQFSQEILSLPMYPELSGAQVGSVVDTIKKFKSA